LEERFERYQPDLRAYHRRARTGPCFVCAIVAGDSAFPGHPILYEDEKTIAFLTTKPTQYGYTLVCPKEHREQATGDFAMEEYLDLQRVVYRVAEAVRAEVGAERMYMMTLGSKQGNSHVHWHVVPLPPACLTTSSRAPGRVGARACSRYLPRRWRTWQDVSAAGSD
jgi:diadenosine tetraphosphate (Ap4A) HIT family hydrolase